MDLFHLNVHTQKSPPEGGTEMRTPSSVRHSHLFNVWKLSKGMEMVTCMLIIESKNSTKTKSQRDDGRV